MFDTMTGFTSARFFIPDTQMVDSIIEYVNGRLILDVGCGDGSFISSLMKQGHLKVVGIDPYSDVRESAHKIWGEVGSLPQLLSVLNTDPIVVKMMETFGPTGMIVTLCRPCHSPELIDDTYKLCKRYNIPLLYIGLDRNIKMDLYNIDYEILDIKGTSKENEKVYLLK